MFYFFDWTVVVDLDVFFSLTVFDFFVTGLLNVTLFFFFRLKLTADWAVPTTVQSKNKTFSTKKTKTTKTTETTTTTTSNDYAGSDDTQFDEESFSSIKEQEEQAGPSKRLRSRRVYSGSSILWTAKGVSIRVHRIENCKKSTKKTSFFCLNIYYLNSSIYKSFKSFI